MRPGWRARTRLRPDGRDGGTADKTSIISDNASEAIHQCVPLQNHHPAGEDRLCKRDRSLRFVRVRVLRRDRDTSVLRAAPAGGELRECRECSRENDGRDQRWPHSHR